MTGVDDLAKFESNEVVDFRKHMYEMCERTARTRDSQVMNAAAATAAAAATTTTTAAAAARWLLGLVVKHWSRST